MSNMQRNGGDDLQAVWQSQNGMTREEMKAMMEQIVERGKKFERTIRQRNLQEYAAAALMAPVFVWIGRHAHSGLEQAGYYLIAAAAVWIVVFLWLKHRGQRIPDHGLSLAEYRDRLLAQYDRQIRLLGRAGWWYVLPLYAGLMLTSAGHMYQKWLERGTVSRFDGVLPVFCTIVAVGCWYLNEVYAVRRLRQERRRVEEGLGG